jgi:hypothetical protein
VTETKAASPSVIARVLPSLGLCAAIVVNAAWIGFLGYWIFRLVDLGNRVLRPRQCQSGGKCRDGIGLCANEP